MNSIGRQTTVRPGRWGVAAALFLALGVGACDSLLEVDLPSAVTEDAVNDASVAPILLSSIMGQFECAYNNFTYDAAGQEDNFQMVSGVAGNYSQYTATPGGGGCGSGAYSQSYRDPLLIARRQGSQTYNSMVNDWGTSQRLVATTAFYTAATLDVFGEHFCEFAIDGGALMTPANTLDSAEAWVNRTMTAIAAAGVPGGTFPITTNSGEHTDDIEMSAYGLLARIQWARGDLADAAISAAEVDDGHVTWVLREEGSSRKNTPSSAQSGGGGIQAAGFLQGPVKLKGATDSYGVTALGSHPNGTPWTSPVRFTGYIDLGIETTTGRAINAAGFPVLETDAGAEDDTRVTHTVGNTAGGPLDIPQRYPNLDDDIPLINWKEMRLIRAEAAGATQTGIDHVNVIRAADGLPEIGGGGDDTYRDSLIGDADAYEDMLLEEARRALWQEGRFWSRKIIHNEKLWFPRAEGDLINTGASYTFGGGVRQLLSGTEYQVNENFVALGGLDARGKGCDAIGEVTSLYQAPVGF